MSNPYKPGLRVAIYCRISLARDGETEKVERQEADCRALCERLGWTIVEIFVDNSRSAWQRNRHRPGWDAMLDGIRNNRFDALVVYHGDRLIRQPYDLELLLNLAAERGVRLASPTGTRDLGNADDRFILRIEAAQACRESDNTSRRVARAREARRAAGIVQLAPIRGFGRNLDGSICEPEAKLIRAAFARIIAGETMTGLWKEWTVAGVPTVRGGRWRYTTFHQMLLRPDLAGLVSYRGEVLGKASNIEAIVDREVWEAVQGLIGAVGERQARGPRARRHLLAGIAICSSCDQPMAIGQVARTGAMRYQCTVPTCGRHMARNMEHLDDYVIAFVLERLADPRLWERLEAARRAEAAGDENAGAELAALEARRGMVLSQLAEDDAVSPAELAGVLRKLDERIAAARARIGVQRSAGVLEGLAGLDRAGWDGLPLDRRRAVVRRLCTVRVLPVPRGPGFRPECVDLRDAV